MSWGRLPIPGMNPGESLDSFHDRCVTLSPGEQTSKSQAVDAFVQFLYQQFSGSRPSVSRVIKGGSLGKGTAVQGQSDIDLVVYLNDFSGMAAFKSERTRVLQDIKAKAASYRGIRSASFEGSTPYSVQYEFKGEELDILPTVDVLGTIGKEAVYSNIGRAGGYQRNEEAQTYSAALTPLQIDFVKTQSETVKRAIRLLKYWKNQKGVNIRSYTIELVTIYAARAGYGGSTKTLFEGVLNLLKNAGNLRVAFNDNYNSGNYTRSLEAPYVLDPANPFKDTLQGCNVYNLSQAASQSL